MVSPSPLKKISIFSSFGKAELALLEAQAARRKFPADAIVIREGEDSDSMCVILSGEVSVLVADSQGEQVTMDTMGEGDYFGEYALFDGSKRSASIVTTRESSILFVTRDAIMDLFNDSPESAFSLIVDLIERIHELTDSAKHV